MPTPRRTIKIRSLPRRRCRQYARSNGSLGGEDEGHPRADRDPAGAARSRILKEFVDKYPPEIQAAIAKACGRTESVSSGRCTTRRSRTWTIDDDAAAKPLKGEDKKKYAALKAELKKFADLHPGELPVGIGMHDVSAKAPATHVLKVGAYDNPHGRSAAGLPDDACSRSGQAFRRRTESHGPPDRSGELADRSCQSACPRA